MFTSRKILVLIALYCSAQFAFTQKSVQAKADDYFNQFAYAQAIPLYERMVEKEYNALHALQRLAECHLLLRHFEKSIPYFEKIVDSTSTPTNYYFKYAMALKSAGRNEDALQWLKKYKKTNKNDKRVNQFLENGNLASVVFNSRERYEVEPVAFNTEFNEFGAFVQEGKLYFSSSRKVTGNEEVYEWDNQPWLDIFYVDAQKARHGQAGRDTIEAVRLENEINSKLHESSLVFSTDYKNDTVIYFTRNNLFNDKEGFFELEKKKNLIEKRNNLKIYRADKVNGEWKVTKNLEMNADHYSSGHPTVNPNRTKLYFTSDMPGGYGGTDIYYCEIHDRGGLRKPVNAGPIINTAGNESFPFINNEGKLFFSSDGHVGFGQLDVFATVTDEAGTIVDVINLGKPLNSEKDDFAYYSNEDGTEGFVSSNREGGVGNDDIYKFTFTPSLYVYGTITDAINGQKLDSVHVKLLDKKTGNFIKETYTDIEGKYRMFINRNTDYIIDVYKKTHPRKQLALSTVNLKESTNKIQKDIALTPIMDVKVLAGLNKIYFDFDKHDIRPDAAKELDKVVHLMTKVYPEMAIRLESHTDPVGSHEYNDNLSEQRAKSTYMYLVNAGVDRERILSFKGFGKREPVNDCQTQFDCPSKILELNRRTEFPIVRFSKSFDAKVAK